MLTRFFIAVISVAATLLWFPALGTAQQAPPTPAPLPTSSAAVTPSASPSPAPSASPQVLPSPSPSVSPVVTPTPSPTPTPTASPSPSPTPLPTPLSLPPDAPPQILAVTVSDPVFHSGETVSGTVITSTNVAAVELRLAGHIVRMSRLDFGVWQLTYTVPRIPFYLRNTYTVQVVALNTAGLAAEKDVRISLR